MSIGYALGRESRFMLKQRSVVVWLLLLLCLSAFAVAMGIAEVNQQRQTITELRQQDERARMHAQAQQKDYGMAAYRGFHLTYDSPSNFAFAALGSRDEIPWKHRIRMLALEGQIYERDVGNPVFALIGRLDFAFLTAFVWPLVLILLLQDLKSSERSAGRFELLVATAGDGDGLWQGRLIVRTLALLTALLLPLLVAMVISATGFTTALVVLLAVFGYAGFWAAICYWRIAREMRPAAVLTQLMAIWLLLCVALPLAGRLAVDRVVPVPRAADILLTQREAVNSAWDLPKQVTMQQFVERHPQWRDHSAVNQPFAWKWYYALQQQGDHQTEPLASAFLQGRQQRDRYAGALAWVMPPVLLQRALERWAHTDLSAALAYESRVRDFHRQLRQFYYPLLFLPEPYSVQRLEQQPQFQAP